MSCTNMCTCTHARTHAYVFMYAHAFTHTCTHTHTHTHTHAHTLIAHYLRGLPQLYRIRGHCVQPYCHMLPKDLGMLETKELWRREHTNICDSIVYYPLPQMLPYQPNQGRSNIIIMINQMIKLISVFCIAVEEMSSKSCRQDHAHLTFPIEGSKSVVTTGSGKAKGVEEALRDVRDFV